MDTRYKVNAFGEIIDTENFHRHVALIERDKNGRRYLGDTEVTHIWNNPAKLKEAIEAYMAAQ